MKKKRRKNEQPEFERTEGGDINCTLPDGRVGYALTEREAKKAAEAVTSQDVRDE